MKSNNKIQTQPNLVSASSAINKALENCTTLRPIAVLVVANNVQVMTQYCLKYPENLGKCRKALEILQNFAKRNFLGKI